MPEGKAAAEPARIGVIDLGSNSLRLVVFERLGGALFQLLNEKVMCGLARGIAASGRLNREGVALALANMRRFMALAQAIGVEHLAILATAAVRDASDGEAFADEVARQCGAPVTIIDGAEEARLSAAGVLAGIPEARGVVGDLGGGSVELVRVGSELPSVGAIGRIGAGITLPLGPLRLAALGDSPKAIGEAVERAFTDAVRWRAPPGQDFYLVGGASRALARLHMEHVAYPLHIVHHYAIPRGAAEGFFEVIGRQSRKSLERITTIPRRRLEMAPIAAAILRRLVGLIGPQRVVFSAFGLREGYAYGLIPPSERGEDPLIAACKAIAQSQSRFSADGDFLQRWTAPLFRELPDRRRRLHRAACWLADIAWSEHPDYRAGLAFARSLRMPYPAASHAERVFIASVLHARYAGSADDPVKLPTRHLLDEPANAEARSLGLALRLAYTLCGGVVRLLSAAWLRREGGAIVLEMSPQDDLVEGEAVQRRLDAVARSLNAAPVLRRGAARQAANA
jgi:exopolyphosphatase/guanosine-5'-triphosphate,3'-diphosphate pyrophosphatase